MTKVRLADRRGTSAMTLADTDPWTEPSSGGAWVKKAWLWGLFLTTLTFIAGCAWLLCYKVIPHQRASLILTISGTSSHWMIDETNWMLGGETEARVARLDEAFSSLTKSSLGQLASLHRLTVLDLNPAYGLRDADLSLLDDLPALRTLRLDRSTNADEIWGPKVTDLGLARIASLHELEDLSLVNQRALTDAGLVALKALPRLKSVNLSGTKIGDAGMIHLGQCPSLQVLDLKNTDITDAGLVHLRGMRSLELVDVEGTAITQAGVVALTPTLSESVLVGYGKGAAHRPRPEFKEAFR
jgi:hypothetical protein